jgi:hypothetical protein
MWWVGYTIGLVLGLWLGYSYGWEDGQWSARTEMRGKIDAIRQRIEGRRFW